MLHNRFLITTNTKDGHFNITKSTIFAHMLQIYRKYIFLQCFCKLSVPYGNWTKSARSIEIPYYLPNIFLSIFLLENILRLIPVIRSPKYNVREERTGYTVLMWLLIKKFTEKDVGSYKCVSTNSLGKADGTLRLYGKFTRMWMCFYGFRFAIYQNFQNSVRYLFSEIKIGFERASRGKDHVSIIGGK